MVSCDTRQDKTNPQHSKKFKIKFKQFFCFSFLLQKSKKDYKHFRIRDCVQGVKRHLQPSIAYSLIIWDN